MLHCSSLHSQELQTKQHEPHSVTMQVNAFAECDELRTFGSMPLLVLHLKNSSQEGAGRGVWRLPVVHGVHIPICHIQCDSKAVHAISAGGFPAWALPGIAHASSPCTAALVQTIHSTAQHSTAQHSTEQRSTGYVLCLDCCSSPCQMLHPNISGQQLNPAFAERSGCCN